MAMVVFGPECAGPQGRQEQDVVHQQCPLEVQCRQCTSSVSVFRFGLDRWFRDLVLVSTTLHGCLEVRYAQCVCVLVGHLISLM